MSANAARGTVVLYIVQVLLKLDRDDLAALSGRGQQINKYSPRILVDLG